ncbi:MAG: rod shape-determining protein MreC, partial [Glaciimonas sp.]|nr:rod shape-determining protein MreC [Glaciimonas sp.]
EYSPPPLFKQGTPARVKAILCAMLAIALLISDSRMQSLTLLRQTVATALFPLQKIALVPRNTVQGVSNYFSSLATVEKENQTLQLEQAARAQQLQQAQLLASENAQLRKLLGAQQQQPVKSVMSEILYDARDPFTRKVIMDKGSQFGVVAGQPVIDDAGIVGQVTRVFPFTSEVTLLTDKDQAIPVQILRNGLRSVAYGRGQSGYLDLRFMASNADIKKDDILVTSGIDGVYPAGLAVAKVVAVETKSADAFSHIVCEPIAGIDKHKQLLILLVDPHPEARPDDVVAPTNGKVDTLSKRRFNDRADSKDAAEAVKQIEKKPEQKTEKNSATQKNQKERSQ